MLRNRDVTRFITLFMIVFIGSIILAFLVDMSPVILVSSIGIVYGIVYLLFTWKRYRHIRNLSKYVRQISYGDYALDVRDNEEGELSILKNEIYKVTNTLAEQSKALQDDKVHLMDSLSDISHQLKTPLTSMTMMTDFLASPTLPEEKREEFSSLLLKQLERLDWLGTSLLKLSKIDAGTVDFKQESIRVRSFIESVLERLPMNNEQDGVHVEIQGEEDVHIQCDGKWTAEAFINIINNSIQHSPPNEALQIKWVSNVLYTRITVKDQGPGIPLEERTQIFKRFFKGKHAHEDSIGIGLAMAYSIITKQQGTIEIESEHGGGTSFIITFYHLK